ncbi:MAG: fumarate hydrolyase [Candidatus Altiarchaeales archaeon]|nr:fumarate hydrolyase [Candidatus Altiarchaeales archaeon]
MLRINTPLTRESVMKLRCGDVIKLTGQVVTARDRAHRYLVGEKRRLPFNLEGGAIYHCGPLVEGNRIVAAGPTTSMRLEAYQAQVLRDYGVSAVIGKGGMGEETLRALKSFGCVYLAAVGGAATFLAESIRNVYGVFMREEFGEAEAFWLLEVEDFPAIVAMDAHGCDLYSTVGGKAKVKLQEILVGR